MDSLQTEQICSISRISDVVLSPQPTELWLIAGDSNLDHKHQRNRKHNNAPLHSCDDGAIPASLCCRPRVAHDEHIGICHSTTFHSFSIMATMATPSSATADPAASSWIAPIGIRIGIGIGSNAVFTFVFIPFDAIASIPAGEFTTAIPGGDLNCQRCSDRLCSCCDCLCSQKLPPASDGFGVRQPVLPRCRIVR